MLSNGLIKHSFLSPKLKHKRLGWFVLHRKPFRLSDKYIKNALKDSSSIKSAGGWDVKNKIK